VGPVVNSRFAKGIPIMEFKKGLTVVYPHHGAAEILEVAKKEFRGEKKLYLKLRVEQGNLIIWVPADTAESEVGVRDVIDAKGVKKVEKTLKEEFIEEPTNWSRRFKANQEKLASGDVMKVSEIVRDLWRRQQDRGLSAGEKRMLAKAMQILVSELALALKVDDAGAETHILKVLAKGIA
jgi:CarD family transcriptional regulator